MLIFARTIIVDKNNRSRFNGELDLKHIKQKTKIQNNKTVREYLQLLTH